MASFDKIALRRDGTYASASKLLHRAPEDIFLAWVLWLPAGADIAECARAEIARIDACSTESSAGQQLRELFRHAAGLTH